MKAVVSISLVLLVSGGGAAARAAPAAHVPSSTAIDPILACLDVPAADARLTCFESNARKLKEATAKKDVIVLDQTEVAKTKRSLFGFTVALPNWLNGNGDKEAKGDRKRPELDNLEATIKSAFRSGNGWTIILDDDARWVTIEAPRDSYELRSGMPIKIHQAALGSYLATVNKSMYLRIRRVN